MSGYQRYQKKGNWTVYILVNRITGHLFYVGITSRVFPTSRLEEHFTSGSATSQYIQRIGASNIDIQVFETGFEWCADAESKEYQLIQKLSAIGCKLTNRTWNPRHNWSL